MGIWLQLLWNNKLKWYSYFSFLCQYDYYHDLSETAGIENIKPVINKIMEDCSRKYIYELDTYRNDRFKVLDDETFVKLPMTTAWN